MATAEAALEPQLSMIMRHAQSLRFPYWETPFEYRFFTVERQGRLEDDRWVLSDGLHKYHWACDAWRIERHTEESWEDWQFATARPLAEALRMAEIKAAAMRHEVTRQVAHAVARLEAGQDIPKENV